MTATTRGPTRSCQRPPSTAPTPRKKMAMENGAVACALVHPNAACKGWVKTLHA